MRSKYLAANSTVCNHVTHVAASMRMPTLRREWLWPSVQWLLVTLCVRLPDATGFKAERLPPAHLGAAAVLLEALHDGHDRVDHVRAVLHQLAAVPILPSASAVSPQA